MILAPVFQPIANVATGRFVAAEALSRWHSAERVLSPLDVEAFIHWGSVDIALAKFLCGLESCYERLFINVSPETLESTMIFQIWSKFIQALVERSSIKIVIEVTENITDPQLQSRWEALSALGVELALDDFGDQHSTLERLTAYPWNYCKFSAKRLSCLTDYPAVMYCKNSLSPPLQSRLKQRLSLSVQSASVWYGSRVFAMQGPLRSMNMQSEPG
jgi:EAL domain-containing protein (putative c-di-GMP-specific phosphodiesterase class I)